MFQAQKLKIKDRINYSIFMNHWISKAFLSFVLSAQLFAQATAPQTAAPEEKVRAINAPKNPLPPEDKSANVTKFSFVVYGDTRGRRDGRELQYEHSMVINSVLERIKKQAETEFPLRFVMQSGDAVVSGLIAQQLNVSYVDLINRITTDGGIPYFLAPGNHDVTGALTVENALRIKGVKNFLEMNANLLPPDGSLRRLDGYPVFAFAYGNTFVLAMDTQIAGDEKQFQWIKQQLEGLDRKRYKNLLVYGHHPFFSSGPHGGAHVEEATKIMREKYAPLFRQHHVNIYFCGHEHFFEHWVERYEDASGKKYRMDQVLTGGGGAPLYEYRGDPDTKDYLKAFAAEKVSLERIAKPGATPGENAFHYVVVKVDGEKINLEIVGLDWGRDFQPYRSNKADLGQE